MYRCTECYTEYTELPEYCDCGNDTFEEVAEQEVYEEEEEYIEPEPRPTRPKRKPSKEELEEMRKEELEKKKSLIAAGVILFLCIVVFFMPPHAKKKMDVVKEKVAKERLQLPGVNSFWDNTVPSKHRAKDPLANLPVLNHRFASITPELREYLVDIGSEFDRKWDRSIVNGFGEAKVQFTIDKEGNIASKTIISSSHNDTLDNSVLLALSKVNSFNMPPDSYKGEKIYITFKISPNKDSHVVYPMK